MELHKKKIFVGYCSIAVGILCLIQVFISPDRSDVSYSDFKKQVRLKEIKSVVVTQDNLRGYAELLPEKSEPLFPKNVTVAARVDDPDLVGFLERSEADIIGENRNSALAALAGWFLPAALFGALGHFMMRRMQQGGGSQIQLMGKTKARIVGGKTGVTFDAVAGQAEAKAELKDVIDALVNPEAYKTMGARAPKGVLLAGPPGTGKTLFAKAIAGEAQVPFFYLSGSEFLEMFVGVGAARVRDLFEQAKKNAPCIIFIDEIDAMGKSRGSGAASGGTEEREQTLNQLLVEMDGFDENSGIVLLASTNRPETLDPALLRPGRFDRQVVIGKPDRNERLAILKHHFKSKPLAEGVDLSRMAGQTAGWSGAELGNLANEAALLAVRKRAAAVGAEDVELAFERIAVGLEKKNGPASDERTVRTIAVHELGHAVLAALNPALGRIQKITVVPRTSGPLGFTLQVPEADRPYQTKSDLLAKIDTLLAGRAAEEVFFHEVSTGAQQDLAQATKTARAMAAAFGMSDTVGLVSYVAEQGGYLARDQTYNFPSDAAAEAVDATVRAILSDRMSRVRGIIEANQELIEELARDLMARETLEHDEISARLNAQTIRIAL